MQTLKLQYAYHDLPIFLLLHCWGCLRLNLRNTYAKQTNKQKQKRKQEISPEATVSVRLLLATALI